MILTRRSDWNARLAAHLSTVDRLPMNWTGSDCLLHLVGRGVEAMTDVDPVAQLRGRYTTARGAVRVMRNEGHATLADAVAAHLPEIHPSRAQAGDIAAIPSDDGFGFALGLVGGSVLHVMAEEGRAVVPRSLMTRAFKV
ncbi:DUF6950 family protein [Pseudooceanicola sp. MF1-13]|uniref:DUF6950 family protein n=1 Tax=Pseudooceanicola sp. MF1-13 TaxID=3379095 RepID=UPI0038911E16